MKRVTNPGNDMYYRYLIAAMAMVGFTTQANAEIIALDCGFYNTPYNVWIDTEKSFATVKGYMDGSFPAQITPTSITWSYPGQLTTEVVVDRTAGTIRWHILPNSTGASLDRTDSCTRGSTPFPATKF